MGGHRVEPSATPGPAGGRPEFASHPVQQVGNLRGLRRQRPFPDARRVSLHHAHHPFHAVRRHARAGAGPARRGVGGGDERIGAVVNIQKRPLRALKKNLRVPPRRLVQQHHRVGDKRFQTVPGRAILGVDLGEGKRLGPEGAQNLVVLLDLEAQQRLETVRVDQINHPQSRPRRLVAVGRADAAFGRADFVFALERFALRIQFAMIGKHQMGRLADAQIARPARPAVSIRPFPPPNSPGPPPRRCR